MFQMEQPISFVMLNVMQFLSGFSCLCIQGIHKQAECVSYLRHSLFPENALIFKWIFFQYGPRDFKQTLKTNKTKTKQKKKKSKTLRPLTFKCNVMKIVLIMPLKYIPVTQSILCLIFLMCVATMHHYTTMDENLIYTICSLWFWHTCDLEIQERS